MSADALDATRPLRISLLAHQLRVAGGAVVGKNLLKAIASLAPQHHYQISIPDDSEYHEILSAFPNCKSIVFRHGGLMRRLFREKREIAERVLSYRPDVLFGIGGIGLVNPPCPQALFIQDAHYFYPARCYSMESASQRLIKAYHKRALGRQLKRTELLFCHTSVARDRLKQTFRYEGKIEICPNGIVDFPQKSKDVSAAANRVGNAGDSYKLLYLAKYYPHKNLEGIVRMFDQFRGELENVVAIITIAPNQHPHATRLLASIREKGLEKHIINVGPIPQSEVGAFYAYCDALLMPTILESFGIPYLEAMYFGAPILTSDLDFAREMCGDAAVYFDPQDTAAMKDAVLQIRRDAELSARLVAAGKVRLDSKFIGWDEVAARMLRRLEAMAHQPNRRESH